MDWDKRREGIAREVRHAVMDDTTTYNLSPSERAEYRRKRSLIAADGILALLSKEEEGIPEGFVMVPREPTREMLNAAIDVDSYKLGDISPLGFRISPQMMFERCYRAMIEAAPTCPPSASGLVGNSETPQPQSFGVTGPESQSGMDRLKRVVEAFDGDELWLDDNRPWRIMLTKGRFHSAVAEQHPETAMGDGEWKDGKAICNIVNAAIALVAEPSSETLSANTATASAASEVNPIKSPLTRKGETR
jgi:hypothetical protein